MRVIADRRFMRGVWILAILAVVTGSLLPGDSPALKPVFMLHFSDKTLHFLGYVVLAWFPVWIESRRVALLACVGLAALGAALELLQLLVPGRSCDLRDFIADLAGVACGAALSAALGAAVATRWRSRA